MRGYVKAGSESSSGMPWLSMAGLITLAALSLESCSVADAELATNGALPSKQHEETIGKTRPDNTEYGYSNADEMSKASADKDTIAAPQARETKTAYLGSAPYICSASGFGQKSRCFLR
ncbi:hypothetical protein G6N76_08710 [Rhizobium daejeonense]|uniref:Uncharacterized protein n=1 Tax=Rhizobium daejeonense TaxID=240521 RepID=A0A6M1SAJ4_9HYPH|nr:hypothetical protein [Rhizobium daejeonense]NGO63756.1 hypothetical protein [Rhizobium daejeonense]